MLSTYADRYTEEDQCKTLMESRAGRLSAVFGGGPGAGEVPPAVELKAKLKGVIDVGFVLCTAVE